MKKILLKFNFLIMGLTCFSCNKGPSISLNKTYLSIGMGDVVKLEANIVGPSKDITWKSEDSKVATVDNNGLVTPISYGSSVITATANGVTTKCDVKVRTKAILLGVDAGGDFFFNVSKPEPFKEIFNNNHSAMTVEKGELTSIPTKSAQCWGSMLTGVSPEIHKFTVDKIAINENTKHPSIFKEAYNQIPDAKLASFVNWSPINVGIIENKISVVKKNK